MEVELAVGSNARQVNKHTAIWDHHLFNFWKGNSDVVLNKEKRLDEGTSCKLEDLI